MRECCCWGCIRPAVVKEQVDDGTGRKRDLPFCEKHKTKEPKK